MEYTSPFLVPLKQYFRHTVLKLVDEGC